MDDESVNLLNRFRAGDQKAATELHERYVHRLIALARSRISSKLARRIDPEDVVQSVYRSFFTDALGDRYELHHSGDLWRLLSSITINKVLRQVQRHRRKKRSIDMDQSVIANAGDLGVPPEALAAGPAPADALTVVEELEHLMQGLEPLHRRILEFRLQGLSTDQIAGEISRSDRTVRRVLERVQAILEQRLLDVTGDS